MGFQMAERVLLRQKSKRKRIAGVSEVTMRSGIALKSGFSVAMSDSWIQCEQGICPKLIPGFYAFRGDTVIYSLRGFRVVALDG